ncbi:2OG-Fe dioxygenase family protein [Salinisphaera sp. G21_0]|uniref:2OG-Fe dioxygenase family protein n=1 Tax=Salinisphaera sp. G21_0 TaxID=2821094 RepID=UPI001ADB97C9|nr:2OG-Fe dioxygenase family protein [Salinisphaera sp. G21_0]MBO9482154.1 2OG-Fe dioxygenase family protein [Salinisphaera sp. G21_0]
MSSIMLQTLYNSISNGRRATMALISPDFTFSHQRLTDLDLNAFAPFFANLAADPYVSGHYRFRRYSRFTGPAECLERLPHDDFVQSRSVNYLSGDILREFAEIEPALTELPEFQSLFRQVNGFFGLDPARTVYGVHQIRITCSGADHGLPVPEGIHQDGFDLIAIICTDRKNVEGAETGIFYHPEQKPAYSATLLPGDIVYCNDRRVYHYTSALQVSSGEVSGHRDVFVITVTLEDEQWKNSITQPASSASESNFQPLSG